MAACPLRQAAVRGDHLSMVRELTDSGNDRRRSSATSRRPAQQAACNGEYLVTGWGLWKGKLFKKLFPHEIFQAFFLNIFE